LPSRHRHWAHRQPWCSRSISPRCGQDAIRSIRSESALVTDSTWGVVTLSSRTGPSGERAALCRAWSASASRPQRPIERSQHQGDEVLQDGHLSKVYSEKGKFCVPEPQIDWKVLTSLPAKLTGTVTAPVSGQPPAVVVPWT
jgi:hypothetical protein